MKFLDNNLGENDLSVVELDVPHKQVLENDSPVYPDIDK
jgi:hypothetical protein